MKKLISLLSVLLVSATLAVAAETNSTSLFSDKELRLDAFATYQHDADWGYGLGLTYYQTKNIGVSVWTAKDNFDWGNGKFFQTLDTSLLLRVPVTDVLAPYVTLGNRWNIEDDLFVPVAGLGAEYRITKKFGAFVEGTYGFGEWGRWSLPEWKDVGVRMGVKLGF